MSTSHKFCLKSIISEKTQIQYKRKQKNLFVAKAIEAMPLASIAGKNRDQGSIFSQETRQRGYWRPRKQKAFFCLLLLRSKFRSQIMHFLINTQRKSFKTLTKRRFHAKIM